MYTGQMELRFRDMKLQLLQTQQKQEKDRATAKKTRGKAAKSASNVPEDVVELLPIITQCAALTHISQHPWDTRKGEWVSEWTKILVQTAELYKVVGPESRLLKYFGQIKFIEDEWQEALKAQRNYFTGQFHGAFGEASSRAKGELYLKSLTTITPGDIALTLMMIRFRYCSHIAFGQLLRVDGDYGPETHLDDLKQYLIYNWNKPGIVRLRKWCNSVIFKNKRPDFLKTEEAERWAAAEAENERLRELAELNDAMDIVDNDVPPFSLTSSHSSASQAFHTEPALAPLPRPIVPPTAPLAAPTISTTSQPTSQASKSLSSASAARALFRAGLAWGSKPGSFVQRPIAASVAAPEVTIGNTEVELDERSEHDTDNHVNWNANVQVEQDGSDLDRFDASFADLSLHNCAPRRATHPAHKTSAGRVSSTLQSVSADHRPDSEADSDPEEEVPPLPKKRPLSTKRPKLPPSPAPSDDGTDDDDDGPPMLTTALPMSMTAPESTNGAAALKVSKASKASKLSKAPKEPATTKVPLATKAAKRPGFKSKTIPAAQASEVPTRAQAGG
ncbi:hypothetical protein PsYK624_170060 [Phanerochaete sordida]|uniref:Uncharacterized protein n=1 Tax=Phanerochaete sordida TaxID=48140 RepID=A0A9P3LPI8_9APHY|nr:hypothetical protein PsYK624_170060 [Phanerochaete sordida]